MEMDMEIEVKKKFVLGKPTAYKPQVKRTKKLINETTENVIECYSDVFRAHEWIVKKQGEWAKITWTSIARIRPRYDCGEGTY